MNIQTIDIHKLQISPFNVRKLSNELLNELKTNIEIHGLLNPITVKFNNDNNMYEIIAGQRRFHAMKELNFNNIQCNVIASNTIERDQIILSLTENIHRENMNLSDKIKTYKKLLIYYDNNPKKLSTNINIDTKLISQCMAISHFPDSILDKLDKRGNDKISLQFAVLLSKINITDEDELNEIIQIFYDIKHTDRIKLMKKIMNTEKYGGTEFHNFIQKIGNTKTLFLKEVEEQKQKKIKTDYIKYLEKQNQQDINIKSINIVQQNIINDIIINQDDINKKIHEIKEKNNSLYINTQIRNPELQSMYRKAIIQRFNNCIISNYDNEICEASHIIPFSESENFDIDNGILLNNILHKLFDKHYWSINPITLCFEIFKSPSNDIHNIMKQYDKQCIEILKKYPEINKYLVNHYNKSKELSIK
jgi:ParB family chromosome partitioning protein